MLKKNYFLPLFILLTACLNAQTPALVGYWHNWNTANAPYIQLDQIDSRYNVVEVAFAVPAAGTDYSMTFVPDQVSQATLISKIQILQAQGKKVLISMGGGNATVSLDNITERDIFITTMGTIINTYGFNGIDIDFEGSSVSITGGTIAAPVDAKIINLIYAIKKIMENYRIAHNNTKLMLTMAPETAFVQGGMSAYGGVWGAYLPVIHALRDSLDILQVQLYNSGSMYGINGGIYTQGTADFIVAMTEAVIVGFTAVGTGGPFAGLPASKIAIGLPACPSAAGGGFTSTSVVASAMNYLRGTGPKPGSYTLQQAGGYPTLRGMMTWSINWDAVNTCNTSSYQYAQNYQQIFNIPLPIELLRFDAIAKKEGVLLSWQTRNEQDLVLYEVEHAIDGHSFESIGTVAPYLDNEDPYSFLHTQPVSADNYYRLRMEYLDGRIEYSATLYAQFKGREAVLQIVPNPVADLLYIKGRNASGVYQIVNRYGQVVQQGEVLENQPISVQDLPSGLYYLSLEGGATRFVKR